MLHGVLFDIIVLLMKCGAVRHSNEINTMNTMTKVITKLANDRYSALVAEANEKGVSVQSEWFSERVAEINSKAINALSNISRDEIDYSEDNY